jgi:hypothetical protein
VTGERAGRLQEEPGAELFIGGDGFIESAVEVADESDDGEGHEHDGPEDEEETGAALEPA